MRRLLPLILALCLLLPGCGNAPAEEAPAGTTTTAPVETTTQPTEASTDTPTEDTTAAPTEDTTVPVEPPAPVEPEYRHPLTGEPLASPFTGRVTTVVLGNTPDALPQYGISKADFVYELETEGGITRMLAVYTDLYSANWIGPVRSARTFFNNITLSYDGVLTHCGGSVRGRRGYHDLYGSKIPTWAHLNSQIYREGTYINGAFTNDNWDFFRDKDRRNSGVAHEHTLFTTGEKLMALVQKQGYEKTYEDGLDFGLQFADEVVLNGAAANTVTVKFKQWKTTTFTYDPETGLYSAAQYDQPHIDGETGETLTYKNLLVLQTSQTGKHDGEYVRSYYELVGSGTGFFACNGQIVPITWQRADLNTPFSYTLADGTPVTLGVGTSYVGIVGGNGTAVYE